MWMRISLLFALAVLVVVHQVLLKAGLDSVGGFSFTPFWANIRKLLSSHLFVGAVLLGMLGSLAWYWLLSRMPLSVAGPALGIMLVIGRVVAAWLVLGEVIPASRWGGMVLACVGIWLIAR